MRVNRGWTEELRVPVSGLAGGKLILDQRQRLLRGAIAMVLADFDVLVLLEWEQEFSRGEIVLIANRQPNAWRDFRLIERKHAAAIELPENSATEGHVADHVRLAAR